MSGRFPVLDGRGSSVPWEMVEPLRAKLLREHGQTPEQLAARGGLSVVELYLHVHGRSIRELLRGAVLDLGEAQTWFKELER